MVELGIEKQVPKNLRMDAAALRPLAAGWSPNNIALRGNRLSARRGVARLNPGSAGDLTPMSRIRTPLATVLAAMFAELP